MQLPRFIPADKANHRARGADVAGTIAALAVMVVMLLFRKPAVAAAAAAIASPLSAYIAGKLVERWQARKNRISAAHGGEDLYTIDPLDVKATLRGAVPVALPLAVLALLLMR
jgi:hypothetical protein